MAESIREWDRGAGSAGGSSSAAHPCCGAVLTIGFSVYGLATVRSVVSLGLLTALAAFLAFFLDLLFTPALLALVYRC